MIDNLNQVQSEPQIMTVPEPPVSPAPSVSPVPPVSVTPITTTINYAGFGRRFLASLIDGILLGIVGGILGSIGSAVTIGVPKDSNEGIIMATIFSLTMSFLSGLISLIYYIYFIGKDGQTLGKKALGIKVVKINSTEAPGYTTAFLREAIGKFVSGIVLGLGYLWMIWDSKKQTWHDKIAGTIVVRV